MTLADGTLQVLLVDDEPRVTAGLARALRSLRPRWKLRAVDSGAAALAKLAEVALDVVVTDLRMPGMSGSELIREVELRHPLVVRIMLSGVVDPSLVAQAQGWSQRYLFKPCPPERLVDEITAAVAMRESQQAMERAARCPPTTPGS